MIKARSSRGHRLVTLILVTDVGDNFEMLVTDSANWTRETFHRHNDNVTDILKLSPSYSHQNSQRIWIQASLIPALGSVLNSIMSAEPCGQIKNNEKDKNHLIKCIILSVLSLNAKCEERIINDSSANSYFKLIFNTTHDNYKWLEIT